MRILHILDHSLPLQSGYSFRTLSVLRSQRRLGHETFHLTAPRHNAVERAWEEVDGWLFHRTAQPAGMRIPLAGQLWMMQSLERRLEELVREIEPDLLYAHSPFTNGWPALRVARRHRLPTAYEVRALWEDAAVEHGSIRAWGPQYRTIRLLETLLMRKVDAVAVICRGLREEILGRGIAESKVSVVPNTVGSHFLAAQRSVRPDLQERLGLVGCTVLGFAGSFYKYEGLATLIDAMPDLVRRFPKLRVLLVGGGREESVLRQQAHDAALDRHVIFAGRVRHEEVAAYYDLVDIFVYPRLRSRLTETVTPLKPLEAMAAGRLVVASDVGGHRELIENGQTGFMYRASDVDSLVRCLDDVLSAPHSWHEIRCAARAFVERERTEATMINRYREMLVHFEPGQRVLVGTG